MITKHLLLRVGNTVRGVEAPPPALSDGERKALLELAEKHDLAHLTGISPEDRTFRDRAVRRYIQSDYEFRRICDLLEGEGIPFLPLKGAVLRQYYPQPWMRTSCDIDILVRESDLDRALASLEEKLRYTRQGRSGHDVSLFAPGGVHLELHFALTEPDRLGRACEEILESAWDWAVLAPGKLHQRELPEEMFYFCHMAHMALHTVSGGCGLRPFLDVWVMNHRIEYSPKKRRQLLERGGLEAFAAGVEEAAECWFAGGPETALSRQLLEFTAGAGAYGTARGKAAMQQTRQGGRLRYLLTRRIFAPGEVLRARYPRLKERPWLLPAYQLVRWTELLKKDRIRNARAEWRANSRVDRDDAAQASQLLAELGLDG